MGGILLLCARKALRLRLLHSHHTAVRHHKEERTLHISAGGVHYSRDSSYVGCSSSLHLEPLVSVRGNRKSPGPSESSSGEGSNRFQESWREVNVSVSDGGLRGKELEGGHVGGREVGSGGLSFFLFVFGRVSGWGDWAALVDTSISK